MCGRRTAKALAAIAAACALLVAAFTAGGAALAAGAAPSAHSSVIGGHPAMVAEAPWLAAIAIDGPFGSSFCSGTAIAPRVVLTAGHCVRAGLNALVPAKGFRVATGVTNLADRANRVVSRVKRAVAYPSFEIAREETDAGLLFLTKPVTTPQLPIATAADAALTAAGTKVTIAGWGRTDPESENPPLTARTGVVELQSPEYCQAHAAHGPPPYRIPTYAPERQLCAADKPDHRTTGCFGDSGGPITAPRADGTPVEVGIVSGGSPSCGFEVPESFTRVDTISDWILGWVAVAEAGAPPPPTPAASPPYLFLGEATELDREALQVVFGPRFRRGAHKSTRCRRRAWEVIDCRNRWRQGGHRYHGRGSVRVDVVRGQAIVSIQVTTHWVDEECKSTRGPKCEVRTRERTFRFRPF